MKYNTIPNEESLSPLFAPIEGQEQPSLPRVGLPGCKGIHGDLVTPSLRYEREERGRKRGAVLAVGNGGDGGDGGKGGLVGGEGGGGGDGGSFGGKVFKGFPGDCGVEEKLQKELRKLKKKQKKQEKQKRKKQQDFEQTLLRLMTDE